MVGAEGREQLVSMLRVPRGEARPCPSASAQGPGQGRAA